MMSRPSCLPAVAFGKGGSRMSRRALLRNGAGLAAILAAGKAPAAIVRSMLAARQSICTGVRKPKPAYWGLCFTAEEPSVVVNMVKTGSPVAVTLEASTDGENWTSFDPDGGTTPVTLGNVGDRVYFRAGSGGNVSISSGLLRSRKFTLSGRCGASGDVSSLLDAESPLGSLEGRDYAFTVLFNGCTSLTSAPLLPATTLAANCYQRMFANCTSLTSAPLLPATTLAANCYNAMFSGCTSLTSAPLLPATTLAGGCYNMIFQNCSSIQNIEVSFPSWVSGATTKWVEGVADSGTFRCPTALGTDATITRGVANCPDGWTVVNTDAA